MGIEVATVTEQHEVIQEVTDAAGIVAQLATSRWPKLTKTACLRFVEPWGDAVFNQAQLPELLAELHEEVSAAKDVRVKEHLQAITMLVESARDQTHVYVKFIGD